MRLARNRQVPKPKPIRDVLPCTPDTTLLPSQLFDPDQAHNPLRNLQAAVLRQAWLDVWNKSPARATVIDQLTLRCWIHGQYSSGAPYASQPHFGFADICDALGLNPDRVRQVICSTPPNAEFGHNSANRVQRHTVSLGRDRARERQRHEARLRQQALGQGSVAAQEAAC